MKPPYPRGDKELPTRQLIDLLVHKDKAVQFADEHQTAIRHKKDGVLEVYKEPRFEYTKPNGEIRVSNGTIVHMCLRRFSFELIGRNDPVFR